MDIDTVYLDGSDDESVVPKDKTDKEPASVSQSDANKVTDYSNNSKWYVERMKFAYEQLMEHESKWLEFEKEEYLASTSEGSEATKTKDSLHIPENSLHANIAEFREQDAKEMLAINEALNKFNLDENPNDIGSSDNKRSIVEENQSSISEENKKSRIVAENETNVDNVTKKI